MFLHNRVAGGQYRTLTSNVQPLGKVVVTSLKPTPQVAVSHNRAIGMRKVLG